MSFSQEVKVELRNQISQTRHCQLVETATLLLYGGQLCQNERAELEIRIKADQEEILRKYFTLFKKTYNIIPDIKVLEHEFVMVIDNQSDVEATLKGMKVIHEGVLSNHNKLAPVLIKNTCCKRTFLKMAYQLLGSMSDPEKGYHLEFVCAEEEQAIQIQQVIAYFHIEARIILRKKYYVVYLKEGAGIVELLNIVGAHVSLMNFENLRIVKEMRNSINRQVNCEAANINKTVAAYTKQAADIEKLIEHNELERLPENLQEMARVRLEYPDASLQELGTYLVPPVGKSGVNHRLRKISERADSI